MRTLTTLASPAFLAAALLGGGATVLACGTTMPPKELVNARAAYGRVQATPAGQAVPAKVYEAKKALDRAEAEFADKGDEPETRDFAYVAERKAILAEATGNAAIAQQNKAQADREMQALNAQRANNAEGALTAARQQLGRTSDQLAAERDARLKAEQRAKEAMDNLAKVASVKQETRGVVITLSGSVLFASAKYALLPSAQDRLNQVAEALKQGVEDGSTAGITVEGHTDSQGPDDFNMTLSQNRANTVRDYLVSRGVPSAGIRAQGVGEGRPVATNDTAEGRANNRRVEIVVEPARGNAGTAGSAPSTTTPGPQGTGTNPYGR